MTTTPAAVDRSAPVLAHHEIDIAAPLDTIWNLHTDVDGWATNESFAGAPVEADVAGMQSLLDNSLVAWLTQLKAAAEARALSAEVD